MTNRRDFLKAAGAGVLAGPAVAQNAFRRMNVGTARVDVTPDKPRVCASGDTPDPPRAYARLISRCMTLFDGTRRMAIVNYPFNCLDVATPILRERCERELGIGPECLVLLATHNHQGPIQIVSENFDYGRELAEKIFGAIREAIKNEQGPATLLFGNGYGYFTRAQLSYPPDYEIQLLRVDVGSRPVALLFNHPTHPQLGPRNMYGASHPGFAMDEIEATFAGSTAIYADGCGGNQYTYAADGADALAACKARGHELAEVVAGIARGKLEEVTGPIESKLKVLDLPLDDPIPYKRALELAEGVPLDKGFKAFPDPDRDTNWIRALLKHYKESIPFPKKLSDYICTDEEFLVTKLGEPRKYPCRFEEVLGARIGKLTFVAIQGEPLAQIGMRIKEALRARGPAMVFGYFGEHNVYIPTRENVRLDLYQSQVLRVQYTCPVGWSLDVEEEMVKGTLAVVGAEAYPDVRKQKSYPLRRM
ncbi:MAG TPA: twin-arginine translocation signal domain-containing protein [Bryobacteraceae bacterium]|nr:twin-arginine translocation signal domain-containing protein [Bryobacteraceae bacterium]